MTSLLFKQIKPKSTSKKFDHMGFVELLSRGGTIFPVVDWVKILIIEERYYAQ